MFKKYLAILSALVIAFGLTSCSKGTESTDSKTDSNAFVNAEDEEQYLFLPDGVSLDKEHEYDPEDGVWSDYKKGLIKYIEIFPDEEGYISYDPMGVKFVLPEKCHAYLFPETRVGDYENFIIITDEWFPDVNSYIMISTGTSAELEIRPYYDDVKEFLYPDYQIYRSALKSQLKKFTPVLAAAEEIYIYNYFGISDNNNLTKNSDEKTEETKDKIDSMISSEEFDLLGTGIMWSAHGYAPDSEMSDVESEVSDDGNRFDLQMNYSVKRYGIDTDKSVHWIADVNSDDTTGIIAKRVEFSYDVKTDMRFDEDGFLSSISTYIPDNWNGDIYCNNYFVPDNILGKSSPITVEYDKKMERDNRWTQ